jgi:hypothetical protein
MPVVPNEPLTTLELLALVLAHGGAVECDAADAIPQRTWDELHERNLIVTARDFDGDGQTDTTGAGDQALFEWIEYSAARGVWAA